MRDQTNIVSKVIILCAVVILSVSCSPQRRLSKLVRNHPELIEFDTLSITGSVVIPIESADLLLDESIVAAPKSERAETLEVAVPGARAILTIQPKGGGKLSVIREADTLKFSRDTIVPRIQLQQLARSSARGWHEMILDLKSVLYLIIVLYILCHLKKWLDK